MVNIGLEGIMMISALFGVLFGYWTQSWLIGVIGAVVIGVLLALLIGFFAFEMKTDIILGCIAVNMLGAGGTIFLLDMFTGMKVTPVHSSRESYSFQPWISFVLSPYPSWGKFCLDTRC